MALSRLTGVLRPFTVEIYTGNGGQTLRFAGRDPQPWEIPSAEEGGRGGSFSLSGCRRVRFGVGAGFLRLKRSQSW